jgi:hypothetical protein
LSTVVEDAVERLIGDDVPLALFLLQESTPTFMSSRSRNELIPALEQLVQQMRASAEDVPAHEYREH